jgi:hypothetical protein
MCTIIKFVGSFGLESILQAEGSVLRDLGVTLLLIVGMPPVIKVHWVGGNQLSELLAAQQSPPHTLIIQLLQLNIVINQFI